VGAAMSKDYDKVARKIISKLVVDKQNMLGYIKASDIPNLLGPILDKLLKDNKKVKTLLNFNTQENIKELEKVLNDKQSIEGLRKEYFEAVKNYSSVKKENEELKARIEQYEQKPKVQAQNTNSVNLDKKMKIS
jgi:TnpA family transposase